MAAEVKKIGSKHYPPGATVVELPKLHPEKVAQGLEGLIWLFDDGERMLVARAVARLKKLAGKK